MWDAYGYTMQGLRDTFRYEMAFRIEVVLSIGLIPAALFLPVSTLEKILMVGSVLLLLIVELLNTGIEAAIDRISEEKHPLSARAKDAGSAAVFMATLLMLFVWGMILFDLIFKL